MILLDRLGQRSTGIKDFPKFLNASVSQPVQSQSPLPTITEQINKPTTTPGQAPTSSFSDRMGNTAERGIISSLPQWGHIKKRFIADLPANVQLQGIQSILSGQDSQSPVINNFVRGMSSRGMQPEQIRQAFIEHQKNSDNPLVVM